MATKDLLFRFIGQDAGAGREFERMGAYADSTAASFKRLALGGATLAAGITIASVKMAADFQSATTRLITGAGESSKNIDGVRASLLRLAGPMGETATSMAQALYPIESAGFHAKAGVKILQDAIEGAKADGAQIGTVSDAITSALNAYGMGAGKAKGVTNEFVRAVSDGKTTMEALAASIGNVAPEAAALHVPLAQVLAGMTTMTMQGTDASKASQYLRFALASLSNPTSKATSMLKELGLTSATIGDTITKHGLVAGFQQLEDVVGNKFPKGSHQYLAAMSDIVGGTRGLQAVLELTGGHIKTFNADTKNIAAGMNASGKSVEGWKDYTKTFQYALDSVRGALESLLVQFGTNLLPPLTAFAKWLSANLPGAASAAKKAFEAMRPTLDQIGNGFSKIGQTFAPLLHDALKGLGVVAGALVTSIKGLGSAFSSVGNWMSKHSTLVRSIAVGATAAATAFGLWTAAIAAWQLVTKIAIAVQAAFDAVMDANPIMLVVAGIAALAAGIIYAYQHSATFRTIVDDLGTALKTVWTDVLQPVADFLANHWKAALQIAVAVFLPFIALPAEILMHWHQIETFFSALPGKFKSWFKDAVKWLEDAGKKIITGLFDGIKTFWDNEVQGWKDIGSKVKSWFADAGNWLKKVGGDIIHGLFNGLKKFWDNEVQGWKDIGSKVKSWFADAGKWLVDAGKAIISGLFKGLKDAWHSVTGWISGLGGWIKDHKGPIDVDRMLLVPEGQAIMDGLRAGMETGFDRVKTFVSQATAEINAVVARSIAPTSTSKIVLSGQYSSALATAIPQQAISDQLAKQLAAVTKEQDAEVASAQKHYNQTVAAYQKMENQLSASSAKSRTAAQKQEVAALEAAKQAATKNLSDVKNAASGAISAAKNAASAAATAAKNATQAAATAASALVNQLQTQVTNMIQKIQAFQSTISAGLTGDDSVATLWGNITTAQTNAAQAVADAQTQLASAQQNVANSTAPTAADLQAVTDATTALTTAQQALTLANQAATPQGLQSSLGSTLTSAKQFAADLQALVKAGASQDLISQIAGMGPQTGDALAQQLLGAGKTAIKQMSATMATIAKYANSAAQSLSHDFYGQGANALAQFIAGLEKKYPALIKALDPIRKQLSSIFGQTASSITAPKGATAAAAGPSKSDFQKQWTKETADRKDLQKLIDQGNKVSKEKLAAAEAKLINIEQQLIKSAGTNHTDQDRVVRAITQIGPELAAAALISARKGAKN